MFYLFYLSTVVEVLVVPVVLGILGAIYIEKGNSKVAKYFRKFFEL